MSVIVTRTIAAVVLVAVLSGCAGWPRRNEPSQKSNLTTGVVKSQIIKGRTTQAEVLQLFGAPNLITKNRDDDEVWNYNRMSFESARGSDAAFAFLWSGSRALSTATSKSFDLIIIFDQRGIVKDYSLISAAY